MITLDQVRLLEEKIESAVKKIQTLTDMNKQLQAENDALRNKCSELSNSLSTKSERLSTMEQDQNQIETGILKALNRLNSIENSVLSLTGSTPSFEPETKPAAEEIQSNNFQPEIKQESAPAAVSVSEPEAEAETPEYSSEIETSVPDSNTNFVPFENEEIPPESDNPGFDIF